MADVLKVLPLTIVMIAGPQIISSFFFATSERWQATSLGYILGALISVTVFVTAAYLIVKGLKGTSGDASKKHSGHITDIVILVLLALAAVYVFARRKQSEPPKWMGKLQKATPGFAFILGLLLLGVFPTDIVSSFSVGASTAREGHPWTYTVPFIVITVFLVALPALLVVLMGTRAKVFLPKVRTWMNDNSWLVNEIVIAFIFLITLQSLLS
jgi:Sap, sulfolipid-1-addressing protein